MSSLIDQLPAGARGRDLMVETTFGKLVGVNGATNALLFLFLMSEVKAMPRLTPRLSLRRPIDADLKRLFDIYGDAATHQFSPFGPLVEIEQAKALLERWIKHWAEKGYGQWIISTRERPQHVIGFGGIDARDFLEVERVNLGYRFAPEAWGKGYATELGQAALQYGLVELQLPEIYAVTRPNHQASIRILEKIGMHAAGELDDVPGDAPSLMFKARI